MYILLLSLINNKYKDMPMYRYIGILHPMCAYMNTCLYMYICISYTRIQVAMHIREKRSGMSKRSAALGVAF